MSARATSPRSSIGWASPCRPGTLRADRTILRLLPPDPTAMSENQSAYRLWFLVQNDEPKVCFETNGTAWTRDGGKHDLMNLYRDSGHGWPVIFSVAQNLLP
jgi:hypothetical protein